MTAFPKIYFRNIDPQAVKYVTPLKQRLKRFEQQGIEIAYVARFDEAMAKLAPQYFVDHFMADLHAKVVVAGLITRMGNQTWQTWKPYRSLRRAGLTL